MLKPVTIGIAATVIVGALANTEASLSPSDDGLSSSHPQLVAVVPAEIPKLSPSEYAEIRLQAINGPPTAKHNAFIYVHENPEVLHEFVPEALDFLVAAAEAGIPDAQYNLGYLYRTGEWVPQEPEKAQEWLTASANTGHVRAQFWLGLICLEQYYAAGEGPEADKQFACGEKWLRGVINTNQNCPECLWAKSSLGRALLSRSMLDAEGWDLLRGASSAGHAGALRTLYVMEKMLLDFESRGYEHARALLDDLQPFLKSIETQTTQAGDHSKR